MGDERATAMGAFDDGRDAFLAAYAEVPDEALSYLPPSDEYALGALPIHICDSIERYLTIFARIQAADYDALDLGGDETLTAMSRSQHERMLRSRPTAEERAGLVTDVTQIHQRLVTRLAPLDDGTFRRAASVIYDAGGQPYPTSAGAILGWLTDHYTEHVQQIGNLLTRWRSGQDA